MENEMFTCTHCQGRFPIYECYEVSGDLLCPDCADTLTVNCDSCGARIYAADDAGDEHYTLCESCRENRFVSCENCGRLVPDGEAYYLPGDDMPLCEYCYENAVDTVAIHDYSYKPEPIFHGKGLRYFGVELEIDHGGKDRDNAQELLEVANENATNLYIKTDGSLDDGLELVTHPMTLDYHMNTMPWGEVLERALDLGYTSHKAYTCGLHIHISRLAFGNSYEQQETAIARLLYFVEKFWSELLRFSRRTRNQLDKWAARYGMKLHPMDILDDAKRYNFGRYMAVNLTNAHTVELRIFRGTLKLNTLLATLQLVNHLCDVSVFLSDQEIQELSWLDFLQQIYESELIQYLKERSLYVNDPVTADEEE